MANANKTKNLTQSDLVAGQLVLWFPSPSRKRLAVVRRADAPRAEVKLFSGERERAAAKQLRPLRDYLEERARKGQRVLSVKRSTLSQMFFGERLAWLTPKRAHSLRKTLTKHGIRFEPRKWQSADTYIQLMVDESFVRGPAISTADMSLDVILPRWIAPLRLPPTSRDPLGLQAFARSLADKLLPGLTVFTNRAGYYGFLAWAIRELNDEECPANETRRERLNKLERALVLFEFIHHGLDDNSCYLLGQRSKRRLLEAGSPFRLPERILKNQNAAGAFNLYATSLESFGFLSSDSEMGADGRLRYVLEESGKQLAGSFQRWLPSGLKTFALLGGARDREVLRRWGKRLCFSTVGTFATYRKRFLEGFLFGNSTEAQLRYTTVLRLFAEGLLTGKYDRKIVQGHETILTEEESIAGEDLESLGPATPITNERALLHFYGQTPSTENREFQAAAVYELQSLGLSAVFRGITECLRTSGRTKLSSFVERAISQEAAKKSWRIPVARLRTNGPRVSKLVNDIFESEDAISSAALGAILVARVTLGVTAASVSNELMGSPVGQLLEENLQSDLSLAEVVPVLLRSMVERHVSESERKHRQRWCYLEGDSIVKDDLQETGVGFHAMRFPQMYSLCRDVNLVRTDLQYES